MQDAAEVGVLLVEDHASFRQALEVVLLGERELRVVGQVSHAAEAGKAAARIRPQLALIDLDLPDGSGVQAINDIHAASPETACLVLSALTDDVEFGRAIEAGAAAVLHKSIDIAELLRALRAVAGGAVVLPRLDTSRRLRALAAARNQEWEAKILRERLTAREHEILDRLTRGQGHHEIAAQLFISPETAQTHIRNLLGKLGVNSRLEAVVKGLQLRLVDSPHRTQ